MDYSPHHFFIRIRSPPCEKTISLFCIEAYKPSTFIIFAAKYLPDEASVILDVAFTPYYPNELPLLTIQVYQKAIVKPTEFCFRGNIM